MDLAVGFAIFAGLICWPECLDLLAIFAGQNLFLDLPAVFAEPSRINFIFAKLQIQFIIRLVMAVVVVIATLASPYIFIIIVIYFAD